MTKAISIYILLLAIAGAAYLHLLPHMTSDLSEYNIPWYEYLKSHKGLEGLADIKANYSPPYLYVLAIVGKLLPNLNSLTAVKIACIPFLLISSVFVVLIIRLFHKEESTLSSVAGVGYILLPTTMYNVAFMGQVDTMYTSFLLGSFWSLLRFINPLLGFVAFGMALSIKLQAMLFAPFILYFAIHNRRHPVELTVIPISYVLMLLPALIAGRSMNDTFLVYLGQYNEFNSLSMNAPNIHYLIEHVIRWLTPSHEMIYIFIWIFLTLGAAVTLAFISAGLVRTRQSKLFSLSLATLILTTLPYVLPKMHERFFFPADAFSFVLICIIPKFWPIGVCLQAGSFISYLAYCYHVKGAPAIGMVFTSIGLGLLLIVTAVQWKPYGEAIMRRLELSFSALCRVRTALFPY